MSAASWGPVQGQGHTYELQSTLARVPPRKALPPYRQLDSSWRPAWLQRKIITAFALVFAFMAILVEVLLGVLQRNQGLATSEDRLHYLWTYGPTAILTLVVTAWARVVYQAQLVAPWNHLYQPQAKAGKNDNGGLPDYFSMLAPVVAVKSFRHRDWMVSTSVLVSLALQLLIVLSTSLISLEMTGIRNPEFPITLKTGFTGFNSTRNATGGPVAHYTMLGLVQGQLAYPEGTTSRFAYRTIEYNAPGTAALTTAVVGFSASVECEPASVNFTMRDSRRFVQLKSPNCYMESFLNGPDPYPVMEFYTAQVVTGQCQEHEGGPDSYRAAFLMTHTNYTAGVNGSAWITIYLESTQIICKPSYEMSTVEVVKNGSEPVLTPLPDALPGVIEGAHAWDIMQLHFSTYPSTKSTLELRGGAERDGISIYCDQPSLLIYRDQIPTDVRIDSLFDHKYLSSSILIFLPYS